LNKISVQKQKDFETTTSRKSSFHQGTTEKSTETKVFNKKLKI